MDSSGLVISQSIFQGGDKSLKVNSPLMMPHFSWLLHLSLETFTSYDRRGQLRPGVNVFIPELHPWVISGLPWTHPAGVPLCSSIINVHYRYSKCALLLILHIVTFRGASKQVSRLTASVLLFLCRWTRTHNVRQKQREGERENVLFQTLCSLSFASQIDYFWRQFPDFASPLNIHQITKLSMFIKTREHQSFVCSHHPHNSYAQFLKETLNKPPQSSPAPSA